MEKVCQVTFQPSGKRGAVPRGKPLLEAARLLGVGIESLCGGQQRCGKCRVRIERHNPEQPGEGPLTGPLSRLTEAETAHLSLEERPWATASLRAASKGMFGLRPDESRRRGASGPQGMRSEVSAESAVSLFPGIHAHPVLQDLEGEEGRLTAALMERYRLDRPAIDLEALRSLPGCLRQGQWQVTAALWMEREIIALFPGKIDECYGLAIDIGSTTMAAYLCSLVSGKVLARHRHEPPGGLREDVMSGSAGHGPRAAGLARLREASWRS